VQNFNGKFRGQCGLLHHQGSTAQEFPGKAKRCTSDYSCSA